MVYILVVDPLHWRCCRLWARNSPQSWGGVVVVAMNGTIRQAVGGAASIVPIKRIQIEIIFLLWKVKFQPTVIQKSSNAKHYDNLNILIRFFIK